MIKFFRKIKQALPLVYRKTSKYLKNVRGEVEPNIIIFGQPKSGTTALYSKIQKSISNDYHCLMEPDEEKIKELNNIKKPILVKNINIEFNNYFNDFNKKIFIVRDPRDILVSILLYAGGFHKIPESNRPFEEIMRSINLLEKKETNPDSVSLIDLFEELYMWDEVEIMILIEQIGNKVLDFDQNVENYFVVKYEDLIKNNVEELQNYLGFSLVEKTTVDKSLNRVVRTKSSGSWRNWFLEEDIKRIKPLMKNFMIKFNYDYDDWRINNPQRIQPKHCSEYVVKILNEKRKSMGLKPILV